ncbi:MAG: SRPBCC family protein [Bacteroidota bacterium]
MAKSNRTEIVVEPGKQEILITRTFDAPRELVFRIFTDPKHLPQWWGPKYLTTVVEAMDVKSGGQWRFIQRDGKGKVFAFHGVYHEVTAPERIIDTFEFEGLPEKGHVILETHKLEALSGNRTKLTTQSVFQSIVDRDGMVQSGMETGVNESYDRLDDLLSKAASR